MGQRGNHANSLLVYIDALSGSGRTVTLSASLELAPLELSVTISLFPELHTRPLTVPFEENHSRLTSRARRRGKWRSANNALSRNDIATKPLGELFFGHRTIGDTEHDGEEFGVIGANVMPVIQQE